MASTAAGTAASSAVAKGLHALPHPPLAEKHGRSYIGGMLKGEATRERIVDEAVRLMRVATQSAATDPMTGMIDMDLITTGRSAAARTLTSQLADALRPKFIQLGNATLPLEEVRTTLQHETGLQVTVGELREALALLERDGLVRMIRQSTVQITVG